MTTPNPTRGDALADAVNEAAKLLSWRRVQDARAIVAALDGSVEP